MFDRVRLCFMLPRGHGSVITPRTRAIVVNTPHNPTGKVFSRQELEAIADVVRENPRVSRKKNKTKGSDQTRQYTIGAEEGRV